MKEQLFISDIQPQKELFQKPVNGSKLIKPSGGLWTSTLIDYDKGSDWVRWSIEETYRHGADNQFPSWLVTPEDNVNVYVIDTLNDLKKLHKSFLFQPYEELTHLTGLDFEAIAEHYDAIQLTDRGQAETRFSTPSLYGWDCESVLWLKWKIQSVQFLGVRSYG